MWLYASLLIADAETEGLFDPEPEPDPLELLDPEPEPEPDEPEPLPSFPFTLTTDAPLPLPAVVLFPSPFPPSLLADILDKSENIGLSLLVIPYAATAAAIHKTIIIEIIMFALSNVSPPNI